METFTIETAFNHTLWEIIILKYHKKICENHDYCYVEVPEDYNKILKYNQGEKSMKVPFIIYADLECLLEKKNTCHNNPEK